MPSFSEIEQAVETLPPSEQEALLRSLMAKFETRRPTVSSYRTRTQPGGVRPGIDLDKLGQLQEEF